VSIRPQISVWHNPARRLAALGSRLLAKLAYRYRAARDPWVRGVIAALYRPARLAERWGRRRRAGACRRIVHVSPCFFDLASVVGGGERHALELAGAMAAHAEVTLVAFGPCRRSFRDRNGLRVQLFPAWYHRDDDPVNPVSFRFLGTLLRADVIHCHQHEIVLTNLCTLVAALLRRPLFVTDHGGTSAHYGEQYPLDDLVTGFLTMSEFSARRHLTRIEGEGRKAKGESRQARSLF
jgi:hypothetical protein